MNSASRSSVVLEFLKWRQTILVSISNMLVYKLNFALQVMGPVLMFFLIKYNIWTSIYDFQGGGVIGSYTLSAMITYQAWVMVVALLAHGYNSRNLAEDIRLGRISSYLIYPFDFWQYHLSRFIGFQLIQTAIAILTLVALIAIGVLGEWNLFQIGYGILISLLAGCVWYLAQYALGLLAFWLDETWTLRVLLIIMANFFSGAIIPLELFPPWAQTAALYSPFPYLTYVPVKTFMGEAPPLPLPAPIALILWATVAWAIGRVLWKRGIKLYSAAGM